MNIPNYAEDTDAAVEWLKDCADLEGSEAGDIWGALANLWEIGGWFFEGEFARLLEEEVIKQATYAFENFKIEEVEETRTVRTRQLVERDET